MASEAEDREGVGPAGWAAPAADGGSADDGRSSGEGELADVRAAEESGSADVRAGEKGGPADVRAARAMQRLGHALATHDVDPALAARLADELALLASDVAAGPVRDKWLAMAARRGLTDLADPAVWPPPPADGEPIEFDAWSFVGGPLNAFAMGARYWREGEGSRGRAVLGRAYEGPPDRVHGGAVAALFDEVMGATLRVLGSRAYTGRLAVDFLRAAPLGVELDLRGWLARREGRRLYLAGEGSASGVVFARAEATFVEVPPDWQPGKG